MQNLLEIGKIVRTHGIKGAVKVISYLDDVNFSIFKHIYIGKNKVGANIIKALPLNNDAYSIQIDILSSVEIAETYKNQSIYIDRTEYEQFKDKIYLADLIGVPVKSENGKILGEFIDFEDYGASIILTIKCGAVSYSIPYVDEIIKYNDSLNCFVIEEQKFKDLRVWG